MTKILTDEEVYQEAQRRVKAKSKYYKDLLTYVVINTGLFLIWYFATGRGYPWFLWVLGGWGVGLILDFFNTFIWQPGMGKNAIEKEAQKIRKDQS
jgi:hypothetical protein